MVNFIKTIIVTLILGLQLLPAPKFHLGSTQPVIETEEKYVGVNLRVDTRNIFADHYKAKARIARYCGHRTLGLTIENTAGRLMPKELKQLYMARVDFHLIHACEISPDSKDVHVKHLRKVQISFLRQMLDFHSRSLIAPPFTETGIMPLRVRRLLLVLSHLRYLLGLPYVRYARAALNSSLELSGKGKKCWASDLTKAASRLFQCPELVLTRQITDRDVEYYAKLVHKPMLERLQRPTQVTSCMRHYLIVLCLPRGLDRGSTSEVRASHVEASVYERPMRRVKATEE